MAISASLDWLKGQAIELLFPGICVGCGKPGSFFCSVCRCQLPYLTGPVCPGCGKPAAGGVEVCGDCHKSPPAAGSIKSPFVFDGVIRSAIHQLKYKDIRALAQPLAGFLHTYVKENGLAAEALVPVPLHRAKLRERGYNQAELLARELGKLTSWPVEKDTLVRIKDASPQATTTSASERCRNVAGAFACNGRRLDGQRVLLIDDVCTTGATVNACARALRKLPGVSVTALTLAREL